MGTYGPCVPASRIGYVPEAQGGLAPGPRTYWVRAPASTLPYVPRAVAPQALPDFDEGRVAMIVSGLANLRTSSGWRAGDALWAGLATHCTRWVHTRCGLGLGLGLRSANRNRNRNPSPNQVRAHDAG